MFVIRVTSLTSTCIHSHASIHTCMPKRIQLYQNHQHNYWPDNSLSVHQVFQPLIDISLLFAYICFLYNIWYRAVVVRFFLLFVSFFSILFGGVVVVVVAVIRFDSNSHEHIEMKSTSFCGKSVNHCYYVIFVCIRCRHTSFIYYSSHYKKYMVGSVWEWCGMFIVGSFRALCRI